MHTFADPLRHALRVYPERTATVCGDVRHTYLEFVARCRSLGGGYFQQFRPGLQRRFTPVRRTIDL